jgi:hypothetical protein
MQEMKTDTALGPDGKVLGGGEMVVDTNV